jgi:two-component system OmpR family response regulator/two-component system response regulator RstA
MKKILLVEDDKKLSKLIAEYLTNHGYAVKCERQGDKAVYQIINQDYFLVILDINLPGLDGLQICKLVRKSFNGFILMLTARAADDDHVNGLEFGADDYITKPIHPKVLLARIDALSRRVTISAAAQDTLTFGKLSIDLERHEVKFKDKLIDLKPKEFDLLVLLATNPGKVLTRDNIMNAMRGIDYDGIDRSIDLRISYLRHKLDDNIDQPYRIKTIRNRGYVFQVDAWS